MNKVSGRYSIKKALISKCTTQLHRAKNPNFLVIDRKLSSDTFFLRFLLLGSSFIGLGMFLSSKSEYAVKLRRMFSDPIVLRIERLISSSQLREGCSKLLEEIIKDKKTEEAIITFTENTLGNQRIINDTKNFVSEVGINIVQHPPLIMGISSVLTDIISSHAIKEQGLAVLKHLVESPRTKQILSDDFKLLFVREDIIRTMSALMATAIVQSISSNAVQNKVKEFIVDIWSDQNLRWFLMKKSVNFWGQGNIEQRDEDAHNEEEKKEKADNTDNTSSQQPTK